MKFEIMMKVVKGFKKINGMELNEKTEAYLNKLIKKSKENGLVEFNEGGGRTLFFGNFNREMVKISIIQDRRELTKIKVNFKNLLSEVTSLGMKNGF